MAKRRRSKKRMSEKRSCPAASLTSDLFVEVLSRLPAKAVCRAKCVSKTWQNLIRHPDHRSKLRQTLEGFFFRSYNGERFPVTALHFTNVSGRGRPFIFPSFHFLPKHRDIVLLDCCNGLLLCRCSDAPDASHYVVCNPATEKWAVLPDSGQDRAKMVTARLGFDPAVASHFHVFEFLQDEDGGNIGLKVYSSETRGWVHSRENDLSSLDSHPVPITVFLNGCLHIVTLESSVAVVDTKGKILRKIPAPISNGLGLSLIQQSQGCLHYADFVSDAPGLPMVIYALEDYASQEWVLKHTVDNLSLYEGRWANLDLNFRWVAIHPECNLIFFTLWSDNTLRSFDINAQQVHEIRSLGDESQPPYLPYVPFYSEVHDLHM